MKKSKKKNKKVQLILVLQNLLKQSGREILATYSDKRKEFRRIKIFFREEVTNENAPERWMCNRIHEILKNFVKTGHTREVFFEDLPYFSVGTERALIVKIPIYVGALVDVRKIEDKSLTLKPAKDLIHQCPAKEKESDFSRPDLTDFIHQCEEKELLLKKALITVADGVLSILALVNMAFDEDTVYKEINKLNCPFLEKAYEQAKKTT